MRNSTTWQLFILIIYLATFASRSTANEGEVRQAIEQYVVAFNAKDLAAVSEMWSENAIHVDRQSGVKTEGREAIVSDIAAVLQSPEPLRIAGTIGSVRLLTPDVAQVEGDVTVTAGDQDPELGQYSAVLVKRNAQWVIESMDEMPIPQPPSAAAALSELAWLEGSWQDDTKESPVRVKVRWSIGGAFLVRNFEAAGENGSVMQSTQIIGWDPRALEVRSWSFNGDGSFGDGVWSKDGEDWIIRSTQTTADGLAASGTYVIKQQSADVFSVQLVGREIEGEPQPASPVVTVTRVPPQESTTPAISR